MIITVIVVGLAFTVLNLVKKQVVTIQNNFQASSQMTLLKQHLWVDFSRHSQITFDPNSRYLVLHSQTDSTFYKFTDENIISEQDTFEIKVAINKVLFQGKPVSSGNIDAISINEISETDGSNIFVFKKNDATLFMNHDGI
jgi:Tfp pilus assembly protein PilV